MELSFFTKITSNEIETKIPVEFDEATNTETFDTVIASSISYRLLWITLFTGKLTILHTSYRPYAAIGGHFGQPLNRPFIFAASTFCFTKKTFVLCPKRI